MFTGADYRDAAVGYLVAVADRAVAQQAFGECVAMKRVVDHFRANVDYARCQQDGPAREFPAVDPDYESIVGTFDPCDTSQLALRAVPLGLGQHLREQLGAGDPVGETRVVASAWNQGGPAGAAIEQADREVEAGQIDRRGQPGRSRSDNDAV